MKPALAYTRVSDPTQALSGRDGLPRQKRAIADYAEKHGYSIAQWYTEAYTGTDLEFRPAFQQMRLALVAGGPQVVIIERLDRLARDLMIQEAIIADFQRNSWELISTEEPDLCSTHPTRVFIRQVLGAVAQYDRAMIVRKLWGARQQKRATDPEYREGRKRFGHRDGEPETLERIRELHVAGLNLTAIVRVLNQEGRRPRQGRAWYASSVRNILLRTTVEPAASS
jgi:DNA invertase Pin-like site-specific DNA recombinase